MQFIKSMMSLAVLAAVVYLGVTVPLGDKTLFGHFSAIWSSEEAQELVEGVRETSGPMLDKLDRAVSAGLEEARRQTGDAPSTPPAHSNDMVDADGQPDPAGRESAADGEQGPTGATTPAPDADSPSGGHPKPSGATVARTDAAASPTRGDGLGNGLGNDQRSAGFEIRPKIDIHVAP